MEGYDARKGIHPNLMYALCGVGVLLFCAALLFFTTLPLFAVVDPIPYEGKGLVVDCGLGSGEVNCNEKHFFELLGKILNVLIWFATFGLVVLMIYHGARMALNIFLSTGAHAEAKKAQNGMMWGIAGLIIVLGAWLFVSQLFKIAGYKGDPFEIQGFDSEPRGEVEGDGDGG